MDNYPYYGSPPMPMQQQNNFGSFGNMRGTQYMPQNLPQYRIIHVNGEGGARSFRMAPNSEALLLDDTAPIVWLVQSDGAGYTTSVPYTITPYQPAPAVDVQALEMRIKKMEEMLNGNKPDSANAERASLPE